MNKKQEILNRLVFLNRLDELDDAFSNEDNLALLVSDKSTKCSESDVTKKRKLENSLHETTQRTNNIFVGRLSDGQNPLEYLDPDEFQSAYGLSKQTVNDIFQMISYGFNQGTRRGNPKSPMQSLLLTLQFLTTGCFVSSNSLVSQSTTSRILKKVTGLLAEQRSRFIKIPEASCSTSIAENFKQRGGFPNVFACIGSTHIAIKTPSKSVVDDYLNEDNYYSFRLFACTGPNLEFYEIITRWPGASHENKIFNLSEMYQRFEFTTKMDGVLLANERYSCTNFVMTPIEVANEPNQTLDPKYRRYNAAHRKTYSFFEAINILKGRFRCLQNVLACQDETVQSIIVACVVLHNIAIQRNEPVPMDDVVEIKQIRRKDCNNRRHLLISPIQIDPRGIFKRDEIIATHFEQNGEAV